MDGLTAKGELRLAAAPSVDSIEPRVRSSAMLFNRRERPPLRDRLRVAMWPRRSWSRSARYFKKRVMRLSASPHAIAAGVAAGVFASFTPFVGLHFFLSFVVAFLVAGNMLAAALGTAVGNPLTFPFIWAASFKVGSIVLGSHVPGSEHIVHANMSAGVLSDSFQKIWPLIVPMVVGGAVLGLIAGLIGYFVTRYAVAAYQRARRTRLQQRSMAMRAPPRSGLGPEF